jgi:hypothetical protein
MKLLVTACLFLHLGAVSCHPSITQARAVDDCRCLPEDVCWPAEDAWEQLNDSVGGTLVKVTPIGAVCHDPTYDQLACESLRANWDDVATQ